MPTLGTLSWIAASLLGIGLAVAGLNLLRGRSVALSALFAVLFAGGLWTLLGLPAHQALFALLGIGTTGGALVLVFAPSPRLAVSGLFLALLGLTGIYLLLGFPYLAVAHTILHVGVVGALLWLALATLGLGRREADAAPTAGFRPGLAGPILAGALAGMAMVGVVATGGVEGGIDSASLAIRESQTTASVTGGGQLGQLLFGNHHQAGEGPGPVATSRRHTVIACKYLLPVQATGLLVLVTLIGLAILVRNPGSDLKREE